MFDRIAAKISPPIFDDDEEKTRIAGLLNVMLLATILIGAIFLPISIMTEGSYPGILAIVGIITVLSPVLLWILRRGHVKFLSVSLVSILFVASIASVYVIGSVRVPIASTFILCVVIAGLLTGQRGAIATTVLSLIVLLGLWWAENAGFLPFYDHTSAGFASYLTHAVLLISIANLLTLATRSLNDALEEARRSEKALKENNLLLQAEIAERARAEESLRESEGRYRLLAENVRDTIWVMDMNLQFTYFSPSVEQIGYTVQEALALKMGEFLTPSSYGVAIKTFKEELSREGKEPREMFPSRTLELEIKRKDGSPMWFEARVSFLRDAEGQPVGILGVARDLTERKQAEKERADLLARLQEQAQRVQQIVDTVPEGVLLLDAAGKVLLVNPVGEENLAVLSSAEVGDTLTHLGDRSLNDLLSSPTSGLWHEVVVDGRIFEINAQPVKNGHEQDNWVLVMREVTEEREIHQRVEQQSRLAAIGQLAAGIAHDFNNIMAVIVLYTEMGLSLPELPPKLHDQLRTILRQANQATDLIQQILDFSRRAVLERSPMDLVPFLKEQIKLLKRTLPETIRIGLSYGEDSYSINADLTRMQQLILNLVVNARDAMPAGGDLLVELGRVRVDDRNSPPLPEMEAGDWVRVSLTDNGTGIDPEVLPRIFEPFFTTKEVGKGTGLGLAQVWGIVKQHEGHIDVTSKEGQGTTIVLYLPALQVAQPEEPFNEVGSLPRGQGETILVVEDDSDLREALVALVVLMNYRVLSAANGQEALEVFEQHPEVGMVLSDLVMPVMGGEGLFQAMKKRGSDVPVVMLTGHPMERELQSLQAQGLAGWMFKPPKMDQLARLLAQALETR